VSIAPAAALLCCAWARTTAGAQPACHHEEPSAGSTILAPVSHACAPVDVEIAVTLPEPTSPLGQTPLMVESLQEAPPVSRIRVHPADPIPISHVPKHLLHAVLLI
jgi:hypothetical protein